MNIKWLKSKKLALASLASALIMFLNIPDDTKAEYIALINSVFIGAQGLSDGMSKGATSAKAVK